MNEWWHGVAEDFSDLPSVAEAIRLGVRLIMAALLGGILGFERESAGKAAGLRTHMLVALGAALFVLVPQQAGLKELSKVIEGIVAGIGFIGAGAILKTSKEQDIKGLTTAAGIWLTAAVGVAAGLGRVTTAILGTVLAVIILAALQRLSDRINPSVPSGDGGPTPSPPATGDASHDDSDEHP